jgi:hypothetical protein
MKWYVGISLVGAAFWALVGTNAQARLAKGKLLADSDPLVAEAGRLWRPGPMWLDRTKNKKRRVEVLRLIGMDPERRERYEPLHREFAAWNLIESSVAIAFPATVLALFLPWLD